jgi:DNA-binding CsgD family transcriptional regulator/tetratricopeptide (TPR) repeat protein
VPIPTRVGHDATRRLDAEWTVATVLFERDGELAALHDAVADAAGRHGSVVLIAGEAGIGKSRLVDAWLEASGDDARVLTGWCEDLLTSRTLGPFQDIARTTGGRIAEAVAAADTGSLLDALLEELGNPVRPTLVVLEDAHWADDATLDIIRYVGRRIGHLPAVLALTYRNDEVTADHPLRAVIGVLPTALVRRVTPKRLSASAIAALVAGTDLDPRDVADITRGNPFFVTEMIHAGGATPATVADAVVARAHRLPASTRQALELLAVIPTSTPVGEVVELVGSPELALAEQRGFLVVHGDRLEFAHEIARRALLASLPGSTELQHHATLLEHLLTRWRELLATIDDPGDLGVPGDPTRRTPAATAGTPANGHEAASVSDLRRHRSAILHHAVALGRHDIVARYAPGAAADAFLAGAHREALSHQEDALALTHLLGPAQVAKLLLERAWSLHNFRRFTEGVEVARRSAEIYGELGDLQARCRVLLTSSRLLSLAVRYDEASEALDEAAALLPHCEPYVEAELETNRITLWHLTGHHDRVLAAGARARELAQAAGRADLIAHVDNYVGGSMVLLGDEEDGLRRVADAVGLAEHSGWTEAASRAHMNLATWCVTLRRWTPAAAAIDRAIAFYDDHDLPGRRVNTLSRRATAALLRGDWAAAERDLRLVEPRGSRTGPPRGSSTDETLAEAIAAGPRALLAVRSGAEEVDTVLAHAWDRALRTRAASYVVPVACAAMELAWTRGRPADAAPYMGTALEIAGDTLFRGWIEWRLPLVEATPRARTWLEPERTSLTGDWETAAERWRELDMPFERAVELLRSDRTEPTLEALQILDGLGARPAAQVARRRLRDLGVTRVPRGPQHTTRQNPAALTDRQFEVLRLLAEGSTNTEIADRLVVSVRTVDHHVSAILQKLGVTNRQQAAEAALAGGWHRPPRQAATEKERIR